MIPGNTTPINPKPIHAAVINSLAQVRDRAVVTLRSVPPSNITEFHLWKTGQKDLHLADHTETHKTLSELGREETLFNIALEGQSLSLGLIKLKEGERVNHLEITAPFRSGQRFVGNMSFSQNGSLDIMISPSNILIYSGGQDYKKILSDGCIRIARFFVENGFPTWIKMHPSMQFDLQTLTKAPYDPSPINTILDLARKSLYEEITSREGTSQQTGT